LLLGGERTHRFAVDVGQGLKVAGAMVQQPRVSKLVAGVAAVAALVVIGIVVGLVASGGSSQPQVTVKDVASQDEITAFNTLKNACTPTPCFDISLAGQFSDTVTKGIAIGTNPAAGTVVPHGSAVTLILSYGPCATKFCFVRPFPITFSQFKQFQVPPQGP
jgi:hypothetical protein